MNGIIAVEKMTLPISPFRVVYRKRMSDGTTKTCTKATYEKMSKEFGDNKNNTGDVE